MSLVYSTHTTLYDTIYSDQISNFYVNHSNKAHSKSTWHSQFVENITNMTRTLQHLSDKTTVPFHQSRKRRFNLSRRCPAFQASRISSRRQPKAQILSETDRRPWNPTSQICIKVYTHEESCVPSSKIPHLTRKSRSIDSAGEHARDHVINFESRTSEIPLRVSITEHPHVFDGEGFVFNGCLKTLCPVPCHVPVADKKVNLCAISTETTC